MPLGLPISARGGGFDLRHAAGEAADSLEVAYSTDQPTTLVALVRAAFRIGVIGQLALATTTQTASPSAHRLAACPATALPPPNDIRNSTETQLEVASTRPLTCNAIAP